MRASDSAERDLQGPAPRHFFLRGGPAVVLLLAVSFLFNWPYLTAGFMGEDYAFVALLREKPLPVSRLMGLWSTCDYPALTTIWWFEGQGVIAFWRPVPSLLIEASVRLFGNHAFPLHVLSLAVHGLVAGTLFLLVRRLTDRPLIALLAGLFFLSCEDHTMGVGWIAAMTDLVCVLFVNIALLAHAAWLAERKPWTHVAALVALAVALLSKESAVVAPVAIVLLTMLLPRGHDAELIGLGRTAIRRALGRFVRDWLSWTPALLLLVVYVATYKALGFGGVTSGMYVDPLTAPIRYLIHLCGHLPVMWLATLSPVPPSLTMFWPAALTPLAVGGAVVFLLWLAGLWFLRRQALVWWALLVYMIALLPQMASDASERALYFPAVPASMLLALLLAQIRPFARRLVPTAPPAPLLARGVGWAVLVCVFVPGVLLSAAMPHLYAPSFRKPAEQAATIFPDIERQHPEHVFVLNTPGCMHTFYLQPIIAFHAERGLDVRVLSSMNGVMSVERVDETSFVLHADRKGWLTNFFAGALRAMRRLSPGRVYERDMLSATLTKLSRDRRDVLAVRFELDRPLADHSVLFAYWDGTAFRPIDLSALAPGQLVMLADTSDVWASMW